jgi:hypothetical protein
LKLTHNSENSVAFAWSLKNNCYLSLSLYAFMKKAAFTCHRANSGVFSFGFESFKHSNLSSMHRPTFLHG